MKKSNLLVIKDAKWDELACGNCLSIIYGYDEMVCMCCGSHFDGEKTITEKEFKKLEDKKF